MRIRKLLYLLIALIATGCTAPPAAPSPTPARPTAAAAPTSTPARETASAPTPAPAIPISADDLAGTQIEFWHVWDGARGEWIAEQVDAFNLANPYGVIVTAALSKEIFNEVRFALQGGEPPNLAVGFNYHAQAWSDPVNLSVYLSDPQWGYSNEELADFFPSFLLQAGRGQAQLGLPFFRTAEVLLYNRSWASELGFDEPPGTPEELRTQVCAANAAMRRDGNPDNDGQGGLMLGFEPKALVAWMYAFGGGLEAGAEGEGQTFGRSENLAAYRFLRGLLDDGCAWAPDSPYPHAEFAERRGLLLTSTLAGVPAQQAATAAAGSGDTWAPIPYPTRSGAPAALFSGPDLIVLPGAPAEQLAAWLFARWLVEPENGAAWTEATGYYPVRRSTLQRLDAFPPGGAEWIPDGFPFPAQPFWPQYQWAVSDLSRVLFAPLTTLGDIPDLAAEMDALAGEGIFDCCR